MIEMFSVIKFVLLTLILRTVIFSTYVESFSGEISKNKYPKGNCFSEDYVMCRNEKCINRNQVCDGQNDCGDGSDERACWSHRDKQQANRARSSAKYWLEREARNIFKKGEDISSPSRLSVALYFATDNYKAADGKGAEMTCETSLGLLHSMLKERDNLTELTNNELAVYINALIVSCKNPRKFYGMDLVARLRTQVDQEYSVDPATFIALCNAGDSMSQKDVDKLFSVFMTPISESIVDKVALSIIALSCIDRRGDGHVNRSLLTGTVNELRDQLKMDQNAQPLYRSALIIQALFASAADAIEGGAQYLISCQDGGSFGSFMNTYYVLPALSQASLGSINTDHCNFHANENVYQVVDKLEDKGEHVRVKFLLAFGDVFSVSYSIALRIPVHSSLFDLMKMASAVNSKYKFKYITRDSKPYIYKMADVQDDPETGKIPLMKS